ncbi:hypothetical protein BJ742DRAFT_320911 [Cladochytrium replicatum]|nr:hypothetical protein BJ742DRAFT_320911 [Cladochytrium replicatum]
MSSLSEGMSTTWLLTMVALVLSTLILPARSQFNTNDLPLTFDQRGPPYFLLNQTSMFNRVVHARIYRNGNYTLQKGGQVVVSIQQVAKSLSMLKPTYVRGLIRLDNNDDLTPDMIRDFITVRQAVLPGSPSCKFDIELEALQFSFGDGKAIKDKLQMIWAAMRSNPGFQIDAIFFDHWNQAFADSPIAMLVATFFIHQDMKIALGGSLENRKSTY